MQFERVNHGAQFPLRKISTSLPFKRDSLGTDWLLPGQSGHWSFYVYALSVYAQCWLLTTASES